MPPNIPLTLNYVTDKTTPELEDPLLKTEVTKQLSKVAIRVNNERDFIKKTTYNAYVVQVYTTPEAVHGTTIANIFQKIANLFPVNGSGPTTFGGTQPANAYDGIVQCKAIVPDLHDSVVPIPNNIEEIDILTNGQFQKFLNMVPIFYAPATEFLTQPIGFGSIIEVEFNDNNYNEGRIIRVIKSTLASVAPAPSFPTPFTSPPSVPNYPIVGSPSPAPIANTGTPPSTGYKTPRKGNVCWSGNVVPGCNTAGYDAPCKRIPKNGNATEADISRAYPQMAGYADLIVEVANRYGFDPGWLANAINFESNGNSNAVNKQKGVGVAYGLIQFTDNAVKDLNRRYKTNTTKEAIGALDSRQQMFYVDLYFKSLTNNGKTPPISPIDLYMQIFLPCQVGANPCNEFGPATINANNGINSPAEYERRANNKGSKGAQLPCY